MASKDDLSDSMDDWRAAGWGKAELIITIVEVMDAKQSYGDMFVSGKVVLGQGEREKISKTKRVPAATEAIFNEKLDPLKIPPPPNGKDGGIVDWYKRDGEFFIELVSVEDDGMTGKETTTIIGKSS